jgi:hypothetical protein
MSTYSLTTRQFGPNAKGQKLTTQDLDYNFLYLEELAISATSSVGSEFEQENLTTGFKIINKSEVFVPEFGVTISFAGSYLTGSNYNITSGILDYGGGEASVLSYIGSDGTLNQVFVDALSTSLTSGNISTDLGTGLDLATQGSAWFYNDFNNGIQNGLVISDNSARSIVSTGSYFGVSYLEDPFGSQNLTDLLLLTHVGDYIQTNSINGFVSVNLFDTNLFGSTASFVGSYYQGDTFNFNGLIGLGGITFSSMGFNNDVTGDYGQVRIIDGIGIQLVSDVGGTQSNIYVNQAKIDISFGNNSQIELVDNSINLSSSDIAINGVTAWSGTYSTGDLRVVTVTNGIITDVS